MRSPAGGEAHTLELALADCSQSLNAFDDPRHRSGGAEQRPALGQIRRRKEIRRVAKTIATGAIGVQEAPQPRRTLWTSFFKRAREQNQLELQISSTDLSL